MIAFAHKMVALGVIALLLIAAIFYSVAFKSWCRGYEFGWAEQNWGQKIFAENRGVCIKYKSLFEF